MEQINRIELRGAVGSVSKQAYDQGRVAHFTMATNYAYNDRNGGAVIETTWHNVTAWEGKCIPDLDEISKGAKLHVVGRLRIQKFVAQTGEEKVSVDVIANRVTVLKNEDPLQYEM